MTFQQGCNRFFLRVWHVTVSGPCVFIVVFFVATGAPVYRKKPEVSTASATLVAITFYGKVASVGQHLACYLERTKC